MGYLQGKKPSMAQRIASGLTGAMKGAKMGAELAEDVASFGERRKQAEQQRNLVAQQIQSNGLAIKQKQAEGFDLAGNKIQEIFFDSIQSNDPSVAIEQRGQNLAQWYSLRGENFDLPALQKKAVGLKKLIGDEGGAIDRFKNAIAGMGIHNDPLAVERNYKNGMNALKEMAPYLPYGMMDSTKNKLDQRFDAYQQQRTSIEASRVHASGRESSQNRLLNQQTLNEINKFENSEKVKPLIKTMNEAGRASSLLQEKGISSTVPAVQLLMASAFNGGRPTDEDAERLMQNPSVAEAVQRWFSTKAAGSDVQKDRDQYQLLVDTLNQWAQSRYQVAASDWAQGTAGYLQRSPEELLDAVTKRAGSYAKPKAGPVTVDLTPDAMSILDSIPKSPKR